MRVTYQGGFMRTNMLALLFAVVMLVPGMAVAQGVALSGTVTSAEEGNMEGVLVNAKRVGSNMTITVVSDDKGRYQFPATKLEPGKYALSIRAAGYDLARRAMVDVSAGGGAQTDLKLIRARDLAAQLTNAEWLYSMPGDDAQKRALLGCVTCHSLERIVRSKYDADGFLQTIARMGTYANQSTPLLPQRAPRSSLRSSRKRSARSRSLNKKSPPIRRIIRRALISLLPSTRRTSARRRSIT